MSTIAKLSGSDFNRMVQRGAFVDLLPLKVELIYGELRFLNPAGPVHEGEKLVVRHHQSPRDFNSSPMQY